MLRGSIGRWADEMDGLSALVDRVRDEAAVQGGEFSAVSDGKGEQVAVGDLAGGQEAVGIDSACIEQAYVVWPELMAREPTQIGEGFHDARWSAGRIAVAGMPDDSGNAILGHRAGGPMTRPILEQPAVNIQMEFVDWIDQGDQKIHIQQERHRSSSRRRLTCSSVTGELPS